MLETFDFESHCIGLNFEHEVQLQLRACESEGRSTHFDWATSTPVQGQVALAQHSADVLSDSW
jgi:hypothetical protein